MIEIEYYYSVHSAFAYLGAGLLSEIAAGNGRRISHKPMDLNAVVNAANTQGWGGRSKAHRAYFFGREIERWAEFREVAFKGGIPSNHANSITMANLFLIAAMQQTDDVDNFAISIMEAHWLHHADLSDVKVLSSLAKKAGFDPELLLQATSTSKVKAAYQANTDEAIERQFFGSPTYIVDGDAFYGQDRLILVERALSIPFKNECSVL